MTADGTGPDVGPDRFAATTDAIAASIGRVIDGKPEAVRSALVCLLAEGHLLIEDVPGVGKTMLARALAASVQATVRRIQFTPDLLPGDVTGVSVYNQADREFEFKQGAIFAHIVLADEINRSSPKTQSALLEAMEERQVTVDGRTHPLPAPFLVVATQNPLEMEGTYALPEAQRDRFMMRISMGYPDADSEAQMLRQRDSVNPLHALTPVIAAAEVQDLIAWARRLHVSRAVEEYAVAISRATREHPDLRLGASPRATLQLVRAAKVWAALDGRAFVIPDDIVALLHPVFAHRLIPARATGTARGRSGADVVSAALTSIAASVPVPLPVR
ncbi:AAA family ATPase [Microbacterium radiodurans]|uniref:MoxR family ATPase n=1 Tax=Microbacterium radiodurans TaxID=661398 RepID=A0A5J5INP8_9MICO|nr:MoxR family ATPase [Microbacterium radiodurans]KAA9085243.1 MoxR family ATPase [Microbacterium radiodurans]